MTPSGPSHRVFADRSGSRRRRVVVAGAGVATALITGLVVLVAGFLGSSSGHVPGFPGADAVVPSAPPRTSHVSPAAKTTTPRAAQSREPAASSPPSPSPMASPSPTKRHPHPPRPSKKN